MTRYNLSTSWGLAHYRDLAEFARDARAWGFAGIEANYGVTLPGLAELAESGVPISSFHYPGPLRLDEHGSPPYTGPLVPADPAERSVAWEHAAWVIGEAAACGAAAIDFHVADLPALRERENKLARLCQDPGLQSEAYQAAREELLQARAALAPSLVEEACRALEQLLPLAEEYGVRLGLETRVDVRDIPSREEMRELLARFPSPHLGCWHDTGHAHHQEILGFGAGLGWLEELGDRLVGMHLSDCRGLEDHYPPGQGEVDFGAALAFAGPETVLTVEVAGRHSAAEVKAGLAYLEGLRR